MVTVESTMNERGDHIKRLKDKMNTVEDEIFEQFCLQIGVENIRYYKKVVILSHHIFFVDADSSL